MVRAMAAPPVTGTLNRLPLYSKAIHLPSGERAGCCSQRGWVWASAAAIMNSNSVKDANSFLIITVILNGMGVIGAQAAAFFKNREKTVANKGKSDGWGTDSINCAYA